MTYDLYIGDRTYSSWSMRGWLMFRAFDIPAKIKMAGLYAGTLQQDLAPVAPARQVPAMMTPDGAAVYDTLAMAETLAEAYPNMWPADPKARGLARSITAEMHAGFGALRSDCAMNLEHGWADFQVSEAVQADLTRIDRLWTMAMDMSGSDSWLFGDYSLADVFYAPIAARIAGHGLPMSDRAAAYVERHLNQDLFRQWRAMGLTKPVDPRPYRLPFEETSWPGPAPIKAVPIADGPSENSACPYSGDPVTDFLTIDGRVFGFCNPFCRDKTLHDPAAWPAFMEIFNAG